MTLDLLIDNLLSPPILFFFLGVGAVGVRSTLEIPDAISRLFALYLLWAIGFKGGVELNHSGLGMEVLLPLIAAMGISVVTPLLLFPILRRLFSLDDACAVAASYGSVSVVTFITAANFLEAQGVGYGGGMVAALALMESPPVVVALVLRARLSRADHAGMSMGQIVKEALVSGPVFLLLGSLLVGLLAGADRAEPLKAFSNDIFHGVLVLFLLESGMKAASGLRKLGRSATRAIVAGLTIPLASAALGTGVALMLNLPTGDAVLLVVLAASASYIAVPAAMRLAVPNANAGLYLPMALGVTFPFNVCVGIPLYLGLIRVLGDAGG